MLGCPTVTGLKQLPLWHMSRTEHQQQPLGEYITPYERWYGKKPNVTHVKVFGYIAYAHVPDVQRRKLDKKANKLRFVGYSKKSKGYRLFDEDTHKTIIRRDVIFNETVFNWKPREEQSKDTMDVSSTSEEVNQPEDNPAVTENDNP